MVYFLTSSGFWRDDDALNPDNGFADALRGELCGDGKRCSVLLVCSAPEAYAFTDGMAAEMKADLSALGIELSGFYTLDRRNAARAEALVRGAYLVVLAGGHVPTQNRFFEEIGLRELLSEFSGVVVGISAGTMNSARLVYALPELEGEAVDEAYRRFLPGLGITQRMIIPHFQKTREEVLDGLRVIDDIACADSVGRRFYALTDRSYLLGKDGVETVFGEAYLIADGVVVKVSDDGGSCRL